MYLQQAVANEWSNPFRCASSAAAKLYRTPGRGSAVYKVYSEEAWRAGWVTAEAALSATDTSSQQHIACKSSN